MDAVRSIASIGRYLGDPTRAAMLATLLDGRAWTAKELAGITGVTASTASTHLSKLTQANLIQTEKQGRHRYHRLASAEVAHALESLTSLAIQTKSNQCHYQKKHDPLHYARSCYNHLAGELSVKLVEALIAERLLIDTGTDYELTQQGASKFASDLSINVEALKNQRRAFSKKCLDYSERRHHLAGSLGQAVFETFISCKWMIKELKTRRVVVTAKGCRQFKQHFNIDVKQRL